MPVALPSPARSAESDLDVQAVQLFCMGGLTLSFCLLHLVPVSIANAMMLLSGMG
jgi:hypothetical protein